MKPCPGCGLSGHLEIIDVTFDDPGFMVLCRPCQWAAHGETVDEAKENWNRRAEPSRSGWSAAWSALQGKGMIP